LIDSIFPLTPRALSNNSENRHIKVAFFVGLATSGVIPVLHLMVTRGVPNTLFFYAPIIKSLLGYIVGVVVYANRWPEKWWPGMFDTWCSSHQLWHVAILVGIYYHYKSVEGFLAMAKEFACSGSVS
jgi:adiponectin receptor